MNELNEHRRKKYTSQYCRLFYNTYPSRRFRHVEPGRGYEKKRQIRKTHFSDFRGCTTHETREGQHPSRKKNKDNAGILTDTDIVRKGVAESKDLTSMTVESIMTAPFVTIESHQSPCEAQEVMSDEGVRHLVVREGKTITGLVSIRDLLVFYKSRAEGTYSEPKIGID